MPNEPKTQPTAAGMMRAKLSWSGKNKYKGVERDESWDDDMWHGELSDHSWSYGRSGSSVTRGEDIRWWPNYDGGWVAGGSLYKYVPGKGWECMQQADIVAQVGQPHCIVFQMVGYKDTYGVGGNTTITTETEGSQPTPAGSTATVTR